MWWELQKAAVNKGSIPTHQNETIHLNQLNLNMTNPKL